MPESANPAVATPTVPPKRSPGHRGQDVRDTVAEMTAKAHEISLEAGSRMAAAMKDVIGAAAGLSAFSIESARDLVQYMVRRSQMAQDEADKLIAAAEAAYAKKNKGKLPPAKPPAALTSAAFITHSPFDSIAGTSSDVPEPGPRTGPPTPKCGTIAPPETAPPVAPVTRDPPKFT